MAKSVSARPVRSFASKAIAAAARDWKALSPFSVSVTTWIRRFDAVAGPRDQAVGVHRVQVMGQRRLADADLLRQVALRTGAVNLQVEQDQPHRQGAARLLQGLVEGAAHGTGRLVQAQPDRNGKRLWHARQRNTHPSITKSLTSNS